MPPISGSAYRQAMSHLAGAVCLVTCRSEGIDHAMTATAVLALSLDPPLMAVGVDSSTRFHRALGATEQFSVTFLSDQHADKARHFSQRGRDLATQFASLPTRRLANGCLVLPDGLTAVGLHITARLPGGDHVLVVGHVDEVVAPAPTDARPREPLINFRSGFHALGAAVGRDLQTG